MTAGIFEVCPVLFFSSCIAHDWSIPYHGMIFAVLSCLVFLILRNPCSFPIMACFCGTVLYVSPVLFYSSCITHDHSIPSHDMLWALLNMCSLSVIVLYFHFTREIKKENRRLSRINCCHCITYPPQEIISGK